MTIVSAEKRKTKQIARLKRAPEPVVTDRLRSWSSTDSKSKTLTSLLVSAFVNRDAQHMSRLLMKMCDSTGADKALIFEVSDNSKFLNRTHGWFGPENSEASELVDQVPVATVSWLLNKLEKEELLAINHLSELPPDAFAIKAILEARKAKSILVAPLTCSGKIWGMIGCVTSSRQTNWTEQDKDTVVTVASVLSERDVPSPSTACDSTVVGLSCEDALRQSPDSYMILGVDGSPIWVNEAFKKLFGLGEDADLSAFNILLDPMIHELGMYERVEHVLHNGDALKFSVTIPPNSQTGNLLSRSSAEILEVVLYPLHSSDGAIRQTAVRYRDITGSQEQVSHLRTAQERYRLIFAHSRDLMIIAEPNGTVVMANQACMEFFGFSPATLQDITKRTHPDDRNNVRDVVRNLPEMSESIVNLEYLCENAAGYHVPLESTIMSVKLDGLTYIFWQTRDISQRKEIESELQATNEKLALEEQVLEEKNSALKEILRQIGEEKEQIKVQIQANVDRLIVPVLQTLQERADTTEKSYLHFLQSCLNDITSPFVNRLEKLYTKLSPREIEICKMIKNGFSSKDIASTLNISLLTVHKFRQQIRSKLGVNNQQVNLVNHLNSLKE